MGAARPAPGRRAPRRRGSRIPTQPCEAAVPIVPYARSMPWMPAPSKMPIHRALSGLFGAPPGMTWPARLPVHARVRHAPGRVHGLVLDVVEPGGRLEPLLADGDVVGLGQLEVLPQVQLEAAALDREDHRVLLGELVGRDLRLDVLRPGSERPLRAGRGDRVVDLPAQHRGLEGDAVLALDLAEARRGERDARVLRVPVHVGGDPLDELVDRPPRVGDLGGDRGLDLAAGRLAPGALDGVAALAAVIASATMPSTSARIFAFAAVSFQVSPW